ncbi:MAG: YlxR family protein [Candidatus Binatia bacterium]
MGDVEARTPPQRTCLGCGARDDQKVLLRLVVQGNGELQLDRLGKGRGGYLHRAEGCWKSFLRKRSLYRTFHLEIGREARERLILTLRDRHWE